MKYKVGDIVYVYKPQGYIPEPGWVELMDKFQNKPQKIKSICETTGYIYFESGQGWSWHEDWLEDPVLKLINEVTK